MSSKVLKTILIVFASLVGLAGLFAALMNMAFFDIDEIIVSYSGLPSELLPETERIISTYYGQNLVKLKTADVTGVITQQPVVESVSVSKYFPSKLIVDVTYKDFVLKSYTDEENPHYYLVSYDEIIEVSFKTYKSFDVLKELELDANFAAGLSEDGFDEGFEQVVTMLGQCTSKELITGIKYLNNNRKTFGSIELELSSLDVTLTVKDPVTPQRLDEALAIVEKEVSLYGGAYYILYASVLDRKK